MILFADSKGNIDFRGPPKVQLGPIVSLVNNKPYFTLGMSASSVRSLEYGYQQLQIQGVN